MNNIFWDTNLILDLLARPDFSNSANTILQNGKERGITNCISFLSLANFAYILRKSKKEDLYKLLKFLCLNFNVLANDEKDILNAISYEANDFEDAIQYETARRGHCDCIITRNKKDFSFSHLPIFTPEEYISTQLDPL